MELGYIAAIIYGCIQGITEFFPVSSSGHLSILQVLGLGEIPPEHRLSFNVLLHGGTLIAIILAFYKDILGLCRWMPRAHALMLISMVPCGIAGLLFNDMIEDASQSWWVLLLTYSYTAALLWWSEKRSLSIEAQESHTEEIGVDQIETKELQNQQQGIKEELAAMSWRESISVGFFQIFALLPGVSRSGSTMSGALLAGTKPGLAFRYAFLVGFPLIGAANAKDALDGGFGQMVEALGTGPVLVACLMSLITSVIAVYALRLIVMRRCLRYFSFYCVFVALFCLYFALNQEQLPPT